MAAQSIRTIKIFYCYSQEDDALREQLARHLSPLRRLRYITGWYDRDIQAGTDWKQESETHLDTAHIILLLISANFFASDYHYNVEMQRAFAKYKAGTAHVIPILLRPVNWEETPISELSVLPTDKKPITQWEDQDQAWLNVVQGIREVLGNLLSKQELSLEEIDILYPEQGPLSGKTIGNKYLFGELLGEGAFGQVYKAQHIEMWRQQAIKVLHEHLFRKREFRERFLREAQTLASLDHHYIIHLDDFWTEASQAYFVMPFVSGGTLQGTLDRQRGFFEQDQIIFYFECICDALDYAHKKGIVHLDLKPLNLLIHEDGRLLLSDFGLAHFMKQGVIAGGSSLRIGTPHYMAPEHINGSPEKRSDLFSLGVILYQMLVGRLPFDGLPQDTVLLKNVIESPSALRSLRPELPQSVEDMLEKALAKQPEQRYQTANEFLLALKNAFGVPGWSTLRTSRAASRREFLQSKSTHMTGPLPSTLALSPNDGKEIPLEVPGWSILHASRAAARREILNSKRRTSQVRELVPPRAKTKKKENSVLSSDEQPALVYLSPEEDLTSVRERLEETEARCIILFIPSQTQLRSPAGWRLLHARMRELGKDLSVVSLDRQVRAVAHAAGFRVTETQPRSSASYYRNSSGTRPGSGK